MHTFPHKPRLQELGTLPAPTCVWFQLWNNDSQTFSSESSVLQESFSCADVIIGSANITDAALSVTREWNVHLCALSSGDLLKNIQHEFDNAWQFSSKYTQALYLQYLRTYNALHDDRDSYTSNNEFGVSRSKQGLDSIKPNKMQKEALTSLADLRARGEKKALIISATGTGKTYLCAFDVREYNPKRFLFVVHRETILRQARESFIDIIGGSPDQYGIFGGGKKCRDARYVFATIQTLSREENLYSFDSHEFDYIVIDEAHHIQENDFTSYQKVLQHFKPSFLLGLTATPERTDTYNIYKDFDNNVAFEIRLNQALEMNLLAPFHYYGVADLTINGKVVDDDTTVNDLVSEERLRLIDEQRVL